MNVESRLASVLSNLLMFCIVIKHKLIVPVISSLDYLLASLEEHFGTLDMFLDGKFCYSEKDFRHNDVDSQKKIDYSDRLESLRVAALQKIMNQGGSSGFKSPKR